MNSYEEWGTLFDPERGLLEKKGREVISGLQKLSVLKIEFLSD